RLRVQARFAGAFVKHSMKPEGPTDITRIVLFVLVIGVLLVGSFWTLLPFLSVLIWATTIAVATWPALLRLERLAGGRRSLAVAMMTLLVLLAFIVPLAVAISTLLDAANRSPAVMNDFVAHGLGPPPEWISKLPVFGKRLADEWQTISAGGPQALADFPQPHARSAARRGVGATRGLGKAPLAGFVPSRGGRKFSIP